MTYGNGLQIKYVYDALDRISEVQYNVGEGGAFETVYSYRYDASGRLQSMLPTRSKEFFKMGIGLTIFLKLIVKQFGMV